MTTTLAPAAPTLVHLDVNLIAPHPHNVRDTVGDVTELAASIAKQGLLQPLTVVTVAAFLAHNPDLAELVEIGDYVTIAGHRRLAAAKHAKVATVPAIVNDQLAGPAATVTTMIAENLQRADLSPMEQARAFQRLRDAKLSERAIAKATGVSPGQVHKRLSLLKLPPAVAAEVGDSLTVADALILLELPTHDDILTVWRKLGADSWSTARRLVDSRQATITNERQIADAKTELAAAGITVVQQAGDVLGPNAYKHRLRDIETVDQVTNLDDTIAVVGYGGEPAFYSRTIPIDEVDDEVDEEQARQAAEIAADKTAATAAATARSEACARLLGRNIPAALASEILVEHVLTGTESYRDDIAAGWLGTDLSNYDDDPMAWLAEQAAAAVATALRTAVAVALATAEDDLPAPHNWRGDLNVWEPRHIRHVRRLAAHAGHELSEIEQRLIDHSENPPAPESTEDDTAVPDA